MLWLRAKQATRVHKAMGKVSDSALHYVRSRAKLTTMIQWLQRCHLDRAVGKVSDWAFHKVGPASWLIRRERV